MWKLKGPMVRAGLNNRKGSDTMRQMLAYHRYVYELRLSLLSMSDEGANLLCNQQYVDSTQIELIVERQRCQPIIRRMDARIQHHRLPLVLQNVT